MLFESEVGCSLHRLLMMKSHQITEFGTNYHHYHRICGPTWPAVTSGKLDLPDDAPTKQPVQAARTRSCDTTDSDTPPSQVTPESSGCMLE